MLEPVAVLVLQTQAFLVQWMASGNQNSLSAVTGCWTSGIVACAVNPNAQEAAAGGSPRVQGQPGLYMEILLRETEEEGEGKEAHGDWQRARCHEAAEDK